MRKVSEGRDPFSFGGGDTGGLTLLPALLMP